VQVYNVFAGEPAQVILCQLSQPVNPPSQIFLKFNKQIEVFMLIPTNYFFFKLVKVLQSYGHRK